MKKLLLTSVAALFLVTGTAHAMQHDMSNTWCAKNIPKRAMVDREHYYGNLEQYSLSAIFALAERAVAALVPR